MPERPSLKERAAARFAAVRERWPVVDHAVRAVTHYGNVGGNAQAGAVTYFGFLSFFPILALAFYVVGEIATIYPEAQDDLVAAINEVLPGLIGEGEGQVSLDVFQDNASTVGLVGLIGLLYAGTGWLSALREALATVFQLPRADRAGFVPGKLRDVLGLVLLGSVLLVSVAISGAVTGFSGDILELLGADPDAFGWQALLKLVAHALAIASSTALFLVMFRLLSRPHLPGAGLVQGAVLAAVGFEALKVVAGELVKLTQGQPAFQLFGVSLVLLVWINYFSRVLLLGAAWASTHPDAEDAAEAPDPEEPTGQGHGFGRRR